MNKHRGEIAITLDGQEYVLRPTFGALVEFEDKIGIGAYQAIQEMVQQNVRAKVIVAAIFAGIRGGWPKNAGSPPPTFETVGGMVQRLGLHKAAEVAARWLSNALSSDEDLEKAANAGNDQAPVAS